MIKYALSTKEVHAVRADAVVMFCHEGVRSPGGGTAAMRKALTRAMKNEAFSGKEGEILTWHAPESSPAGRYVVVGCGPQDDLDQETVRRLFAGVAQRLGASTAHLAAQLPPGPARRQDAPLLQAAVEGVALGSYHWNAYISEPRKVQLARITFVGQEGAAATRAIKRGEILARAANLTRDLVCEPPSSMTPRRMEKEARAVARKHGLTLKVYDEKQAAKMGMGCFLGVARGSVEPPRVLHLTYRPTGGSKKHRRVALVGKGITFDSGGLSLKPAVSMETMKCDMAGAAAVLGVFSALKDLKCPVEVHGILMMAENMPSGRAYKPGDILTSMSGKTVEVLNTDAEGRMVLADGLEMARRLKPDCIIDLATLTGACVVALGTLCTGVMGYDQKLVQEVLGAAKISGEKMWPLPFFKEYRPLLDSKVADIKHIGNRWGGAITAGMFLGEFAGKDIPWVHLDIAGPAFADQDQPLSRVGGTGHPVRTLLQFLENGA